MRKILMIFLSAGESFSLLLKRELAAAKNEVGGGGSERDCKFFRIVTATITRQIDIGFLERERRKEEEEKEEDVSFLSFFLASFFPHFHLLPFAAAAKKPFVPTGDSMMMLFYLLFSRGTLFLNSGF